jgi:hypothetical protein
LRCSISSPPVYYEILPAYVAKTRFYAIITPSKPRLVGLRIIILFIGLVKK